MLQLFRHFFGIPSTSTDEPEIRPEERPIYAMPDGMRAYVVGDIHGRAKLLQKMLAAIAFDARERPTDQVFEIFLGDYIDRGMQSREVIELLLAPPPKNHKRICLLGNHEEALLKFLQDPNILRGWANFGGYATLASYGIAIPSSMSPANLVAVRDALLRSLPPTHLNFIQGLRLFYTLGDYLFVHAGINPGTSLGEQKQEHMLWIRDAFLNHKGFFEQYVVHGHSPVTEPDIRDNRANLDVSDAPVDSLCCLMLESIDRRVILMTEEE